MAKTQEELNQLKVEYETLTKKLKELSDSELKMVTGGLPYSSGDEMLCSIYLGTQGIYTECPSEYKGTLSQCEYCHLNNQLSGQEDPNPTKTQPSTETPMPTEVEKY